MLSRLKLVRRNQATNVVDDPNKSPVASPELGHLLPSEEEEEQRPHKQLRLGASENDGPCDQTAQKVTVDENSLHFQTESTPFVSPSVTVKLCFDEKSQTLVPPPNWEKKIEYAIV